MAKIFVGNLPLAVNEVTIRDLFAMHGAVETVSLIADHVTGKPRGVGFVEMSTDDAAKAVAALNGQDLNGRALTVNAAEDRPRTASIAEWRGR